MMIRIVAAALAVVALSAAPVAAGGEGYTPPDVETTVVPDNSIKVTGSNCPPNSDIRYVVTDASGATIATGTGKADSAGAYSLSTAPVPGSGNNLKVTCGNEVLGSTIGGNVASPRSLSATGTNSALPLTRLGFMLVTVGGVALYVARKRLATSSGVDALS